MLFACCCCCCGRCRRCCCTCFAPCYCAKSFVKLLLSASPIKERRQIRNCILFFACGKKKKKKKISVFHVRHSSDNAPLSPRPPRSCLPVYLSSYTNLVQAHTHTGFVCVLEVGYIIKKKEKKKRREDWLPVPK